MIAAMLMMLQLCTKIRRESDMSARKRSFLGKFKENLLSRTKQKGMQPPREGRILGSIFAGYVPLASQSPYPIIVYSVAS